VLLGVTHRSAMAWIARSPCSKAGSCCAAALAGAVQTRENNYADL